MDIFSAYKQVGSYRGGAELCNTTHRTVKKVVERIEAGDAPPPRAERAHNYDEVTELVAERVEKSQGRISAKRMLPIARAAGYKGSARNFRRLVAQAKVLWRNEHHRGRRPAVWSPGEYLVIDWAQAAPGLFIFCAVLAFSRWRFVAFATDQRASTTLALIAEAFTAIGGVPARVLADRMACLKGGVVANVVIPTAEYVRLASHYGFVPDFCHANDPQSKGIVENLCGYAQRDLAVPLLTEAAVTGVPVDLRAANAAARAWCAEVNAAVHSETCAAPDERILVEREVLQPLPSLRLQIGAPSVIRKVDRLSCVRYASARYSVPTRLIGATVAVVVEHGALRIVEPATAVVVAEH
jgi:transposase